MGGYAVETSSYFLYMGIFFIFYSVLANFPANVIIVLKYRHFCEGRTLWLLFR